MKLLPNTPTSEMLDAMKQAHMPFGCLEAAYHAAWLEAPKGSSVKHDAIEQMEVKLHLAKTAPPEVLDGVHAQAVRLMHELASHPQPLLRDCLNFVLEVPEGCKRYREAQRLAERLVEVLQ